MGEKQPEQEPEFSEERQKRFDHILRGVSLIMQEKKLDIESEHVGARVRLDEGVEVYIHAGTEKFSVEQTWEVMSEDSWVLFSFAAHSLADSPVGRLRGSLVKLGSRGLHIARGAAVVRDEPEYLSQLPHAEADGQHQLELSVFISRALQRIRGEGAPRDE